MFNEHCTDILTAFDFIGLREGRDYDGSNAACPVLAAVEHLERMTCFKYSFLNTLRDELVLTMTRQRATVFLFFYLAIPAAGIGIGATWGRHTNNEPKSVIGGITGLVVGIIVAWLLPRLLWNMLRLFARKGWFLKPDPASDVPVMSRDEFITRIGVLRQEQQNHFLSWTITLIAAGAGCAWVCFYMDRTNPQVWIQILTGVGLLVIVVAYFRLRKRAWRRLILKHGLECPACGREITGVAGLACLPEKGLCRHCGTKVIEI